MKKVAIQGRLGSFHEMAARQFFKDEEVEPVCCNTFEEVFRESAEDADTLAIVAIENTIAGSLLHNYELLRDSGMKIVGEHKIHIKHCICCLPEDDWTTITSVESHPVALMQCRGFLSSHSKMTVIEADDTAGSAEHISKNNLRGHAAICHASAAEMYGMKILEDSIEDNKHNYTRFLVLSSPYRNDCNCAEMFKNKSSIVFSLPHTEGSLSKILTILSFYDINLTKIQSLPIIGHEWEYLFYVDVTFDDLIRFRQSIMAIQPLTQQLNILGEYQSS